MLFRLIKALLVLTLVPICVASATELPATSPNGILINRTIPLAHIDELNGETTAPSISLGRWRQALYELQRSAEIDPGWPAARDMRADVANTANQSGISLALVHARYDRLGDNGIPVAAEVFAVGALRDVTYYGAEAVFTLPTANILTHRTNELQEIRLDAGDGRGFQIINPDVPLTVSYASTGRKDLVLTARLIDGRVLTARTSLNVKRLATPAPDATWAVTASQSYDGAVATGQAYVYLAPGHVALTRPVVVVEGFDLDNTMDWPVLYDLLNQANLLEDLRSEGFDAVVLDFTEATEPIQRNAFVLTELLAQVNATTAPGESVALVGASMGGLVARYALLWLEQNAVDHQVRTYLSFDSPHGGANIPLGLQHWLRFFQEESVDAGFLLSRLDTPAARQMLLYHHSVTSGATAGPATLRSAWLTDLANLGNWPVQPRLVGVANGSGTGLNQGFLPGEQIIQYEYRSVLVDIDGDVWSVPDGGGAQMIFDGGMNLIWPLPDRYEAISVGGTLPWDGAPGGYRGSMTQMDETEAPYGDIIALHGDHCFIPTVSALALSGAGPFFDIAGAADLLGQTGFDQVYWPVENQPHIAITAENRQWLLGEIRLGVTAVGDMPVAGLTGPELYPAVPNPFNPRTEISFGLPHPGRVSLGVYDVAGRLVRRLYEQVELPAGRHAVVWRGVNDLGLSQASGLYFTRLDVGGDLRTGRLMLVR